MTATETRTIGPQPGAQTRFLSTTAEIAFYGGKAGVGKSITALLAAGMWVDRKGYAAIVFRRTAPELKGGNSVWEYSQTMYRALGGVAREGADMDWRFPAHALVEFRHLQHEKDKHDHQGKAYNCIVFEEVCQFTESQFWYLYGRLDDRGNCGVTPHIRATCNPDPDSFVRSLIDWWIDENGFAIPERSGVIRWFVRDPAGVLRWFDTRESAYEATGVELPGSLTFIGATSADNKLGDPTAEARLGNLPLVERARLRDGNWNIKSGAGTILRREWFVLVDEPPFPIVATCRGWDKAASEVSDTNKDPDWTKGAKWHRLSDGSRYLSDMVATRSRPAGVFALMRRTVSQDGPATRVAVFRDPGQAGVVDFEQTEKELRKDDQGNAVTVNVVEVPTASGKVELANAWAVIAETGFVAEQKRQAEIAEHGAPRTWAKPRVYIKRGPMADAFLASADAFGGTGHHDDDIDAVSAAEKGLPATGTAESHVLPNTRPSLLGVASNRGRSGPW